MMRDEDGHFFFVGRNDDIITSAGYRIGPFDVESVVMEHPAVAEVAVIGKPDPQRTEIVKAVIVLKSGVEGTEDLKSEIQQLVRQRLSTHAYPREIDFVAALPKTPSGKIQRFILRGGA
jgi:acetyl-CoA synthetase